MFAAKVRLSYETCKKMLAFVCSPYFQRPMQDVVVRAVRKAVSAATIIFTASSIMRFLVFYFFVAKIGISYIFAVSC